MRTRIPSPASIALAAAASLAVACRPEPAPDVPDESVAVAVAPVATDRVALPVLVTGVFGSRDDIPLAFKTGGVIARVLVDQGQRVTRGQALATLDTREIDAAVSKAATGLEKAVRDEARVRRLFDDSVATRAQWQDALSARDAANADMIAARVNREYATIVAPQDGIILQRIAAPGSNIGPGAPVLLLGGAARGRVLRAGLSDRDALRTRTGDPATVRFDALPGATFSGTVTLLARSADPRTGTYNVEIALRGADSLPSGLVGRADIATRGEGTGTTVPVDALVEADADSATVYTLDSPPERGAVAIAVAHRVRIGGLLGDRAAVSGLPEGTLVITRGAPYVTPGARVRVVERGEPRVGASVRGSEP